MDDRGYDAIIAMLVRVAVVAIICATGLLAWCPNNDSITDCSRRHKPQYWDGTRWTCDERGQR